MDDVAQMFISGFQMNITHREQFLSMLRNM